MRVKSCELDERDVSLDVLPAVETTDDTMNIEKDVVVWFLQGLCYRIELSLVGTGVVGLSLSGHRANKIAMHTHSEAYHIYSLSDVGFPIATFLSLVNLMDYDIVLLLSVRRDIESGEPDLTAVLGSGKEVKN